MPHSRIVVAPSILASDFGNLADESRRMIAAGADWLHLDVMDGHFVPNISFGPPVVKCLRHHLPRGAAYFDCHLMVSCPDKWVSDFEQAGADQITFHLEAVGNRCREAMEVAKEIKAKGMDVGLALKPSTPLESAIEALDSGLVHTLLIMTVEPGFGGQTFMESMMGKVKAARERYPNIIIQVDGGLNERTARIAGANGATAIVAGTAVFRTTDASAMIKSIRDAARNR